MLRSVLVLRKLLAKKYEFYAWSCQTYACAFNSFGKNNRVIEKLSGDIKAGCVVIWLVLLIFDGVLYERV